ncbi:MAG: hypothetical protein HEEMFOPI_01227 [Holosporales bacterium]
MAIINIKTISILNDTLLTLREIDVVACMLSGHGIKSLSQFLDIEERTFRTHWQNVKKKLVFFSKEALLKHLEETGVYYLFFNYYIFLKKEEIFRKSIHRNLNKIYRIELQYNPLPHMKLHVELLKRHLKYFDIDVKTTFKNTLEDGIILALNKTIDISRVLKIDDIFKNDTQYFFLILNFLESLNIEISFNKNLFEKLLHKINLENKRGESLSLQSFLTKRNMIFLFIFLSVFFVGSYELFYQNKFDIKVDKPFYQNILKREDLQKKIKHCLNKNQKIAYCTLIGMQGSGKTTLARLFARNCKDILSFEIDAKSLTSAENSFFKLAFLMTKKIEEKELIEFIKRISDQSIRCSQLLDFIEKKMKENGPWILIFDNVLSFDEIEIFIPKDFSIWGKGSVLFTSYNREIANHFGNDSVIFVDELNKNEISNILKTADNKVIEEDIDEFFKDLPKFVLDITIVAQNLKIKKIDFKNNCNIKKIVYKNRKDLFENLFLNILNKNHIYKEIILIISMIDNILISRSFLYSLFEDEIVDNFIDDLRKSGIITEEKIKENGYYFSIHPFVQDVAFSVIQSNLSQHDILDVLEQKLKNLSIKIENKKLSFYFYEELAPHMESFFFRFKKIFSQHHKIHDYSNLILGYCHYFGTRRMEKALCHFNQVLDSKYHAIPDKTVLDLIFFIAVLYTDMGMGTDALKAIEKGISQCRSLDVFKKAEFLSQKGYSLTLFNRFEEAKNVFEEALNLLKKLETNEKTDSLKSTIKGNMAVLFATTFLTKDKETPLKLIEEALSAIHFDGVLKQNIPRFVSYHFATLGYIYCLLGEYDNAFAKGLKQAFHIIDNQLDGCPHHIIKLFIQESYGEYLFWKKEFKKANNLLKKVVEKIYDLRGRQLAPIYRAQTFLMASYLKLKKFEEAEKELNQLMQFNTFGSSNHILFTECMLLYYAGCLNFEKKTYDVAKKYFLLFFEKMNAFLKSFYGENIEIDLKNLLEENKCLEDVLFKYKEAARNSLNKIYPSLEF